MVLRRAPPLRTPCGSRTRTSPEAVLLDLGFYPTTYAHRLIGFTLAMATLLAFLFTIPHPNWIFAAAAVVLFAVLVLWELWAKHPSSTYGCS